MMVLQGTVQVAVGTAGKVAGNMRFLEEFFLSECSEAS